MAQDPGFDLYQAGLSLREPLWKEASIAVGALVFSMGGAWMLIAAPGFKEKLIGAGILLWFGLSVAQRVRSLLTKTPVVRLSPLGLSDSPMPTRTSLRPRRRLWNQSRRDSREDLNALVTSTPLTLIASVIQKERLRKRYASPPNPYHVALAFGLERVASFLRRQGQAGRLTHLVFECRGKKEDQELAEEFEKVCAGANYRGEKLPFRITFADKKTNCCGLQLADLFARPIGRKTLKPGEANRAFAIIETKLYRQGARVQGFGLKVFP